MSLSLIVVLLIAVGVAILLTKMYSNPKSSMDIHNYEDSNEVQSSKSIAENIDIVSKKSESNTSKPKSMDTALSIDGRMKVKTLQSQFKEVFGLTLRLYDGRSFADENSTLASIRKGDAKGGEFSARRNMLVGNFEEKMLSSFGIKVQIAGSDDSYLCNNDLTLMAAYFEDDKKLAKKQK